MGTFVCLCVLKSSSILSFSRSFALSRHFAVKFLLVVFNQLCVDFSRDEFLLQLHFRDSSSWRFLLTAPRPSSQLPSWKKKKNFGFLRFNLKRLNKSQLEKWRIGKTVFSVASTTAASACALTSSLATNSARMQRLLVKVASCVEWRPSSVCRSSFSALCTDKSWESSKELMDR